MKKIVKIKQELEEIIGQPVLFRVHKGRKKYVQFDGCVRDIYTNIFTIMPLSGEQRLQSFAYTDIITKDIWFIKKLS